MTPSAFLESGVKDIGIRFILVGVVPSLFLVLLLIGLQASGAPERAPEGDQVWKTIEQAGTKEGFIVVAAVLLLALLLDPLQLSFFRLLEGYWGNSFPQSIKQRALKRQRRKRTALVDKTNAPASPPPSQQDLEAMEVAKWQLQRRFPEQNRILPTALGNILRAAEDASYEKYGLAAVTVWPRLYPLLPDAMLALLTDRRNQLDLTVRFCLVFTLATVISGCFLISHGWWNLLSLSELLLAWISYQGALASALAYGESIQVAFDLYRFNLLKAMNLPLPADLTAEKELNQQLSQFLQGRTDRAYAAISYTIEKRT